MLQMLVAIISIIIITTSSRGYLARREAWPVLATGTSSTQQAKNNYNFLRDGWLLCTSGWYEDIQAKLDFMSTLHTHFTMHAKRIFIAASVVVLQWILCVLLG